MKKPAEEEINNYLISMKNILTDEKGKINVKNDREKNFVFSYLYNINEKFIKDVLLELKSDDFRKVLLSTNEFHTNEILYQWEKELELTDMSGKKDIRDVYIKTFLDEYNKVVVVISFHKDKDFS